MTKSFLENPVQATQKILGHPKTTFQNVYISFEIKFIYILCVIIGSALILYHADAKRLVLVLEAKRRKLNPAEKSSGTSIVNINNVIK